VKDGEKIHQSLTLKVKGPVAVAAASRRPQEVCLSIRKSERMPLPPIGLRRLDLHLNDPSWERELEDSRETDPVECAIFADGEDAKVTQLIAALDRSHPAVSRFLVFDSKGVISPPCAATIRAALRRIYPAVAVGGGTNLNFAELNRNVAAAAGLDFVSWGINPQVHATDEQTLIENLRAQRATVDTARSLFGNLPVSISPITIPHHTPAAQGWVLRTIANLAEAGVASVTFTGISGGERIVELLDTFGEAAATSSSDPLRAGGLALVKGDRMKILIANFLGMKQTIAVDSEERLTLDPYAIGVADLAI
jgi:hypothetical protein